MSQTNHSPTSFSHDEDPDVSLINIWNVFDFFAQQNKRLVLGAGIGLILSLLMWFGLGTYKAELLVPNFWGMAVNLRSLEASWASLAREISLDPNLSSEDQAFYKTLSSTLWWNTMVIPSYSITKADLKDLVGLPETKGAPIIGITVVATGKNSTVVERQVLRTLDFMRFSSPYIEAREIIFAYEVKNFSAVADIESRLHDAQSKLTLANRRLDHLEGLQKRFPSVGMVVNQLSDPNESGAKYFPISTQIIATKSDIFEAQERIKLLQNSFEVNQLLTQFLTQAKPLILRDRNGIKLVKELLTIEAQLRATLSADNLSQLGALDGIRIKLTDILANYIFTVDQKFSPVIVRSSSWVVAVAGGLFGGFFVALLVCLGLQWLPKVKLHLQSLKNSRSSS